MSSKTEVFGNAKGLLQRIFSVIRDENLSTEVVLPPFMREFFFDIRKFLIRKDPRTNFFDTVRQKNFETSTQKRISQPCQRLEPQVLTSKWTPHPWEMDKEVNICAYGECCHTAFFEDL